MSIIAFGFFAFVSGAVLLYYCLPVSIRWYVPLTASLAFYYIACGIELFGVMLGLTVLAFAGAKIIDDQTKHRAWLAGCVIGLLALMLVLFKDSQFIVDNANRIFALTGTRNEWSMPDVLAPLGISYWMLMLIGYVADVAWLKYPAEQNILKVILFTCYFPQMTLGPFTRYDEMKEVLFQGHRFNADNFCHGLQRIGWGLFKKLVLAERLAVIVSTVYGEGGDGGAFKGIIIIFGAVCYVLQLYTDFSGAIDIVNGTSQMFGITLPENFQQPFFSQSLSEIWRRWHMTLGFWVRDYVMYPVQRALTTRLGKPVRKLLGKKAGKQIPLYLSMLVTWFTVGLWHGGSWKYICASGLFFFTMIVGGMMLQPLFDRIKSLLRIDENVWSWKLFGRLRSFALFCLSVSFGRADSLMAGFAFWRRALNWNPWVLFDGTLFKLGLDGKDFWVMVLGLGLLLGVSCSQAKRGSMREWLSRQNIVFRWAALLGLCCVVAILGLYGVGYEPAEFIYGGF